MPFQLLRIQWGALFLTLLMGCLYSAVHLFNGWALQAFEFSNGVNLIYLPSFLRLSNVLLLGPLWGSMATATGSMLSTFWSSAPMTTDLIVVHGAVSASGALLAWLLLRVLQNRPLVLPRLADLIQLTLLYALLDALLHHALWSWLDAATPATSAGFNAMVLGNINGALAGALMLRWFAQSACLKALKRAKG